MHSVLAPIRALARAGAGARALQAFSAAGLDSVFDDAEVLTLKGRLLKDAAASAPTEAERRSGLAEAASCYAAAAKTAPATYPLINAATLAWLAGDADRGSRLARETLTLLDSGAHEPDTPYWLAATRAEALLLLGREADAQAALRAAVAEAPAAFEDRAATLRQFRLILSAQRRPDAWLDAFRPPAMVHFAGPIGIGEEEGGLAEAIERAVELLQPGTATGALAAGFDIVAAEALARAGAELHIVLPAPVDLFLSASVRPSGEGWESRFEALLEAAASVESLDEHALSGAAALLAERMAVGAVVRDARLCGAEAIMLRVAGAPGDPPPAGARLAEVPANGEGPSLAASPLPAPDRPVALLACASAAIGRLETLAGASAQPLAGGGYVSLADLPSAARFAMRLFDEDPNSRPVLDYVAGAADGAPDLAGIESLLALSPLAFPIATRTAALALEASGGRFRTALAGASESGWGSRDFFSLWTAPGSASDDQLGQ